MNSCFEGMEGSLKGTTNKFEFQGVSSIFPRIMSFLDLENITARGDIYCKAILALVPLSFS